MSPLDDGFFRWATIAGAPLTVPLIEPLFATGMSPVPMSSTATPSPAVR